MFRRYFACAWAVAVLVVAPALAAQPAANGKPIKELVLPGEAFLVEGRAAFLLAPSGPETSRQKPQPWILYAPTLPGYPDEHEKWMHEQFIKAGVAVAGIDVGESYGSPEGRALFTSFYKLLVEQRGYAPKPCLLGRSRGGLWVSSWACDQPEHVSGIAGIYPVFDLHTYPGVEKAAPAYGLTAEQLKSRLAEYNPIERIDVLAKSRIPACFIHGDDDKVVPLKENSAEFVARYKAAGATDSVRLIIAEGQGHNFWEGFFRCRELIDFAIARAREGALRMPDYGPLPPPPPREMHEVEAVIAGAPSPPAKVRPLHVVLVAGKKDHGLGEHDYPAWLRVWSNLLATCDSVRVTTAMDWPTAAEFDSADSIVFYQHGTWNAERAREVDAYLARGGGLVYIHWAVDAGKDTPGFAKRIGLAWQPGQSKYRHGSLDLDFTPGKSHPIVRNFEHVHLHDESYWALGGDPRRVGLLGTGMEEGEPQPLFWTMEPADGRVFVSIAGHYAWTFDDPLYRVLLLRGIAWTAKEPVDRFNALIVPGARIKP